jgi:hypothetical protein
MSLSGREMRCVLGRVKAMVLVLSLVYVGIVRASTASHCGRYLDTGGTAQMLWTNWCWAACMEFLFQEFGASGYDQCVIVSKSCGTGCNWDSWDEVDCWECEYCKPCNNNPYRYLCEDHSWALQDVAYFMLGAGFLDCQVFWANWIEGVERD